METQFVFVMTAGDVAIVVMMLTLILCVWTGVAVHILARGDSWNS
jgi:hypothetical protein